MAHKSNRLVSIGIFLAAAAATFAGITYLAPDLGKSLVSQSGDPNTTGMLTALHAAASVAVGFVVSLVAGFATAGSPAPVEKEPDLPKPTARRPQTAPARQFSGRIQTIPIPQNWKEALNTTYLFDTTGDGATRVTVTVKATTGAQFKKKGGLRGKLERISGVKWQHPKNDADSKTITMVGVITGANRERIVAALEEFALPEQSGQNKE